MIKQRKEGEEKDLEKSNKEQEGVLQALQSDMSDLKRRMEEIKDVVEGTKFFTAWCVTGSVFVASGLALIGMRVSLGCKDFSVYILAVAVGLLMVLSGGLMLIGAFYGETNVKKYPNERGIKTLRGLWNNNKPLFFALLFMGFLVLVGFIFVYIQV